MLLLPAIFESVASLKDRTWKMRFETNELTPEQGIALYENIGQFGFLAFKRDSFKQQEKEVIENLEADFEIKSKTPGQRLRNILYLNWKSKNEGFETFAKYYEFQMDRMAEHWKSKLPE